MLHTIDDLKQRQALPLAAKIEMSYARVRDWVYHYGTDGVYISFSGGKDSTVLLDLVRNKYGFPDVVAAFVDVPTQFPELKKFAQTFDNVDIVKGKMSFMEVCEKYGFPLISKEVSQNVEGARKFVANCKKAEISIEEGREKRLNNWRYYEKSVGAYMYNGGGSRFNSERYAFLIDAPFNVSSFCCDAMKKAPIHKYEKETGRVGMTAQMAEESTLRTLAWLANGCNGFDMKHPISNPLSFWTENDILEYIYVNKLPICSVYGEVVPIDPQLTFEDMGFNMDGSPRKKYATTGAKRTGYMLCGFGCHLDKSPTRFERLKETHPGVYGLLDKCKNNGVTFREAIEWTNEHGNLNIRL